MTDNEIIKALECCLPQNGKRNCDDCPYAECEKGCADKMIKDSLDLINRQKAEIEELKFKNLALSQNRITMPERLEIVNNARDKAIREFAKKLKSKSQLLAPSVYAEPYRAVSIDDINSLVKEMTEENDDKQKA